MMSFFLNLHYSITLPETFDGPLRANNKLSQADHLFVNEIIGPESLAVWKGVDCFMFC